MRIFTTLLVISCCLNVVAQKTDFLIQAKIVNQKGNPIADVYVINPRTMEKEITRSNGVFTITVLPSDSLIFSHISYFRKSVRVFNLLQNHKVILEAESLEIPEVTVSPDQMTDYDRAKKNLSFLNDFKTIEYNKIKPESDPLQSSMTEHNRLMRAEAGSISFLPILGVVDKAVKNHKKKKLYSTDYFSTRKQKEIVSEPNENSEVEVEN